MNLVDTSGWLDYFFDSGNAGYFAEPIENFENLIVPAVSLYAVFKKVNQVADESAALRAISQMKQGRVVPVSEEIALRGALISIKHTLPMARSLLYATGQAEGATIWTQDEDFRNLSGVKFQSARKEISARP